MDVNISLGLACDSGQLTSFSGLVLFGLGCVGKEPNQSGPSDLT